MPAKVSHAHKLLPIALLAIWLNPFRAEPAEASALLKVRDLNTPRDFPAINSRREWLDRAKEIREQVLVSCGLWPLPQKTPLHAHIFGKIERDGYSVEKAYFETYPGFFLAGNLYRPLGHGRGSFPAVLNPHGHWVEGRLADTKDGSTQVRCINLARQGMIAFSCDMVGYNDTHFADAPTNRPFYEIHRQFATNPVDLLWNITPMGLQTWNSIRALDFLESLPDTDPKRLACTGESGGGTQTFMLGAVDDRLAAQAPVVMVSHIMQGGCSCENAPGLRVDYSNMEIAAAPAPRPQMLVAATGDWTKDTPKVEGPAIAHIYGLFNAPERFHYVQFDFGHNYNQTSREAVYGWFGKWLLGHPQVDSVKESACQKEPDSDLRVFSGNELPAGALTQDQFMQFLRQDHQTRWQSLMPLDKLSFRHFQEVMLPAWRHTLQLQWPQPPIQVQNEGVTTSSRFTRTKLTVRRPGEPASIAATWWSPPGMVTDRNPKLIELCEAAPADGTNAPVSLATSASKGPPPLVSALLQHGLAVLVIDQFSSGEPPNQFTNFYSTYNRTKLQARVRDLVTISEAARLLAPSRERPFRVYLAGRGDAGIWALQAAPAVDGVFADCARVDPSDLNVLLSTNLFCPGILNIGGFEGAAILAAPHPLVMHNLNANFQTSGITTAYKSLAAAPRVRCETMDLSDETLVNWAAGL